MEGGDVEEGADVAPPETEEGVHPIPYALHPEP